MLVGHSSHDRQPRQGIYLLRLQHDTVAQGPEFVETRTSLGQLLGKGLAAAAHQQVDAAGSHIGRNGRHVVAVGDMGIERGGRRMVEVAGDDQSGPHTLLPGALGDGNQPLPGRIEPQPGIVGLAAAAERRTRSRRIGHTVVGRPRGNQGDALRTVERRRLVIPGDLQQRNLRQPHAVADHVDDAAHFGLPVGKTTARRRKRRAQYEDCEIRLQRQS